VLKPLIHVAVDFNRIEMPSRRCVHLVLRFATPMPSGAALRVRPECGDRATEISPAKSKWLDARAKVIIAGAHAPLRSRHAASGWRGAVHFIAASIAAWHKS
jgi:hypothetical protein